MKNIAIFVSGNGSNAENIANYFASSLSAKVVLVVSDNPGAYALARAARLGIDSIVVERKSLREQGNITAALLRERNIDLVVLAGFLSLVPHEVVAAYEGRIVNIHPALLPAYGGKGMYGDRVHTAVIENGEKESGITIHYVNERYDEGAVIAQFRIPVDAEDTPESLAAKIHALEYRHYPEVIAALLNDIA